MERVIHFNANLVSITKEDDVLIIGLSEGEDSEHCVLLQYQDKLTLQDIELGHTRYYIGTCDGSSGGYNCLHKVELVGKMVVFLFNQKGQELFDLERLEISLKDGDFSHVKEALRIVFEDDSSVISSTLIC